MDKNCEETKIPYKAPSEKIGCFLSPNKKQLQKNERSCNMYI